MPIVPKLAVLSATGGMPEVEIIVGHLHKARYQFLLFDSTGANPVGVGTPDGQGRTGDAVPDRFPLTNGVNTVNSLHRKSLFWQAALAALAEPDVSAPFVATVRILQDGAIIGLDGGTGALLAGQFHLKVQP